MNVKTTTIAFARCVVFLVFFNRSVVIISGRSHKLVSLEYFSHFCVQICLRVGFLSKIINQIRHLPLFLFLFLLIHRQYYFRPFSGFRCCITHVSNWSNCGAVQPLTFPNREMDISKMETIVQQLAVMVIAFRVEKK